MIDMIETRKIERPGGKADPLDAIDSPTRTRGDPVLGGRSPRSW